MTNKICIYLIFSIILNLAASAQSDSNDTNKLNIKYKFSIGYFGGYATLYDQDLSPGYTNGINTEHGLSFKYTPNKFGVQADFSPFYNENLTDVSIGLSIFYKLIKVERTSFYLYQGNSFRYLNNSNFNRKSKSLNNGLGLGIDIIFLKRMGFDLRFGYSFYDNFSGFGRKGSAGVYYKFN